MVVVGVEVAAQGADAIDVAGLGEDPAAEIRTAEALFERAIDAGDAEAVFEDVPILGVEVVGEELGDCGGADGVLARQPAAVVEGELAGDDSDALEEVGDGSGTVGPGAGLAGDGVAETLAETLGVEVHAVLIGAGEDVWRQRRL